MAQSLAKNYIHIVFSTKNRKPLISPSIENKLYAYIGGICRELECNPVAIGGHNDHIHILCLLSRKIALFNLVEHVKARSSKWIKTQGEEFRNFYWQDGYGAFSVSETHTEKLIDYIKFQKKHHQQKNFENEILEILRKNKVDYDEKYLFD